LAPDAFSLWPSKGFLRKEFFQAIKAHRITGLKTVDQVYSSSNASNWSMANVQRLCDRNWV